MNVKTFELKNYFCTVILGRPDQAMPWDWTVWQRILAVLKNSRCSTIPKDGVRILQTSSDKELKFGRLRLDEVSSLKWTHNSPTTIDQSDKWQFMSVEVWAPNWNICARERHSPLFFFEIFNEASLGPIKKLSFNPIVIIALADEYFSEDEAKKINADLAAIVKPKIIVAKKRKWGQSFGSGYCDAIQDMATDLFKDPVKAYEKNIDLTIFKETWNLFKPKD